ncbi:MAG: hypothetical protein Q8O88_03510 [bacterium]|nr:hypothetical protein [bacterium]
MKEFRRLKSSTVPGWIAHIVLPAFQDKHTNRVYIYNEKGDYVGSITDDGGYRLVGSFDEYDRGKFNPEDDSSVQQAIRYLFLKTQKHEISEMVSEGKDKYNSNIVIFKDLDNWQAEKNMHGSWWINDKNGDWQMRADYNDEKKSLYYTNYQSDDTKYTEHVKQIPTLKQAVRYVFLKSQKPIVKESSKLSIEEMDKMNKHEIVKLKGTEYYAKKDSYDGYSIFEDKWNRIGAYYAFDTGNVLYYNDRIKSTNHAHDKVIKNFNGDIMQALRYVFLKRQSIKESFGLTSEHFGHELISKDIEVGEVIQFSDIDDWVAKRVSLGRIGIYDNRNILMAKIVYVGEGNYVLYYDLCNNDVWAKKKPAKDFSITSIKQIVRWLFLNSQQKNP